MIERSLLSSFKRLKLPHSTSSTTSPSILHFSNNPSSKMSSLLKTPLHSLLPSLTYPIIGAGMAGASGGLLAGSVSKAGGFGFIGAGYFTPSQIIEEIAVARKILEEDVTGKLEVGVGFLGWHLTKIDNSSTKIESYVGSDGKWKPTEEDGIDFSGFPKATEVIDSALNGNVRAIWLGFGNRQEMVFWSRFVRAREAVINQGQAKDKVLLFVVVGDVQQAKEAVEEVGVDVLIVQGNEAGGHGLGSAPPLNTLLTQVQTLLPTLSSPPPLLLAAGGITTGSDLARALKSGSHGAVYGTRFLLTPESSYSALHKSVLLSVKDGENGTKRSLAFDEARAGLHWPEGVDGRGVVNDTVQDYEESRGSVEKRQERYSEAVKKGEAERLIVWAGTGIGKVGEIKPVGEVIKEIVEEALEEIGESRS